MLTLEKKSPLVSTTRLGQPVSGSAQHDRLGRAAQLSDSVHPNPIPQSPLPSAVAFFLSSRPAGHLHCLPSRRHRCCIPRALISDSPWGFPSRSQSATGRGMGGKRRGVEGPSTAGRAMNQAVSLREESSGRTLVDEASLLRVKHLHRLAAWAGAEAGVGPIGALLGRRLAASADTASVPLGAVTFLCQRFVVPASRSRACTPR